MASSPKNESLDSISRTLARVMRLSGSRSMFARQAAAAGVVLTQPSYLLLRVLIDDGPLPMGALARAAQMDVGMATRQVGALVEAGLVTRDPDPADARVSLVAPTQRGDAWPAHFRMCGAATCSARCPGGRPPNFSTSTGC